MLNIFKKKQQVVKFETIDIPKFRYHRNPIDTGAFIENKSEKKCNSCNLTSKYIYLEPYYSKDDVTCLCPTCISNGDAHSKFDLEFQDPECCEEITNKSILEEVCYRTPGYCAWQQERWLACCDDLCEFIGCLDWNQIVLQGIEDEITAAILSNETYIEVGQSLEELIDAINSKDVYLCVFQCLHCKKFKIDINMS